MKAHFFWKGNFTDYQLASILSFKNNGFETILWSPDYHDVEKYGIQLKNSEEILSYSTMDTLTQYSYHDKEKTGVYEKVTLYSDLFRIKLLQKYEGLWIDCDVFCLKPVEEWEIIYNNCDFFISKIIDSELYNGAVLGSSGAHIDNIWSLIESKLKQSTPLRWGEVGPELITMYCNDNNLQGLPEHLFYPINFVEWNRAFSTNLEDINFCLKTTKDSLSYHWWNDFLDANGVKNLPEKQSYLGHLFSTVI